MGSLQVASGVGGGGYVLIFLVASEKREDLGLGEGSEHLRVLAEFGNRGGGGMDDLAVDWTVDKHRRLSL